MIILDNLYAKHPTQNLLFTPKSKISVYKIILFLNYYIEEHIQYDPYIVSNIKVDLIPTSIYTADFMCKAHLYNLHNF